jgi:hypothetical protein
MGLCIGGHGWRDGDLPRPGVEQYGRVFSAQQGLLFWWIVRSRIFCVFELALIMLASVYSSVVCFRWTRTSSFLDDYTHRWLWTISLTTVMQRKPSPSKLVSTLLTPSEYGV